MNNRTINTKYFSEITYTRENNYEIKLSLFTSENNLGR